MSFKKKTLVQNNGKMVKWTDQNDLGVKLHFLPSCGKVGYHTVTFLSTAAQQHPSHGMRSYLADLGLILTCSIPSMYDTRRRMVGAARLG